MNYSAALKVVLFSMLVLLFSACAPARKPVAVGEVPSPRPVSSEDEQYGHEVLSQLSEKFELDYSDPRYDKIVDLVDRLTESISASHQPWHLALFKAPDVVNAAATRGNHIFVWSGLLDATKSDEEIATVLSHELSHVLAGHTDPDPNEQARQILIQVGALAAGVAVAGVVRDPTIAQNVGQIASSVTQEVGSGLLVNPYSRRLELEADQIGLFIMADAGMNPQAAVDFWRRATTNPKFSSSVEFFSTHPLAEDRLAKLEQILPEAMSRYHARITGRKTTPTRRTPNTSTQPTSTGSGQADSFNFSASAPTHDRTLSGERRASGRQSDGELNRSVEKSWKVTSRRAVVYARPKTSSKALGELKTGAKVDEIGKLKGWVEIAYPDHGFVQEKDLKLSSKQR